MDGAYVCCLPSPMYFVIKKRPCPPSPIIWNRGEVSATWMIMKRSLDVCMRALPVPHVMAHELFLAHKHLVNSGTKHLFLVLKPKSMVSEVICRWLLSPSVGHGPCNTTGWSVHAIPFYGLNSCCQRWALNVKGSSIKVGPPLMTIQLDMGNNPGKVGQMGTFQWWHRHGASSQHGWWLEAYNLTVRFAQYLRDTNSLGKPSRKKYGII